ncbi:unnamed protein product, partial [Rotaria sordida]
RTLFHHYERRFTTDDKKQMNQSSSSINAETASRVEDKDNFGGEPKILPLTDKMFSEHGENLDLKLTVIPQRKTHHNDSRLLFCELKNEYPNDITYETTRLACLLVQDDEILWDHMLLSNAMIFNSKYILLLLFGYYEYFDKSFFLESADDIGDIKVKDGNGTLIEKIPMRVWKRKIDLNQTRTAVS